MNKRSPCPPEFRDMFVGYGWRHVEHLYGARTDVIRRWIAESGGLAQLQAERKARKKSANE